MRTFLFFVTSLFFLACFAMLTLSDQTAISSAQDLQASAESTVKEQIKTDEQKIPVCPAQGNWTFCPKFSDEFNGEKLDEKKWYPNNPTWLGRQPGYFSKDNVRVQKGMLELTAKTESLPDLPKGYEKFTTAAVQSKETVLYGYFEVRSRPMDSCASSSFWFYAQEPNRWTEIDVFEMSGAHPVHKNIYHMNLHVFKTPEDGEKHWSNGEEWKAPFDFVDDFHRYGLLWTKEKIEWFVDGKLVNSKKNTHWHQPLTVNFDSETMPDWFGLPAPEDLPSVFSVDYIRCWKETLNK